MENLKIFCFIQARLGSVRFPNKVLSKIGDKTILELIYLRLTKSKYLNKIVFLIPENIKNSPLKKYLRSNNFEYFQGDENNVLDRFYKASLKYKPDLIVRVTGDCPFVDVNILDHMFSIFIKKNLDYISNIDPPTFPDGIDLEIFTNRLLAKTYKSVKLNYDKEHVTPFMRKARGINKENYYAKHDNSNIRVTLDEYEDLKVLIDVFNYHNNNFFLNSNDIIECYKKNPIIFINSHITRNEGASMGTGQKLWKKAKKIIPGGNMLLSKRSEMFLPNLWPSYFEKTKGCNVWDLDNVKYLDLALMGVGTNILGYSNKIVDESVMRAIKKGNMSSLNCPEEVQLIEKLLDMHPWFQMGRLVRTGGEANAVAIRIARAASGKDNVAICGYHGWHDWYLSVNLSTKDGLSDHLLSGLSSTGVPKSLKNTVFPFEYNNFKQLEHLVETKKIGVIKMEVQRNQFPKNNFLKKIRDLATKKNIVLIFDECTSGFRETFGGLHKKFNVYPDMAIFGKALGNGYAINAILGKQSVMESAQSTFISSTFWTERIGPTAAISTLKEMERIKSWEIITDLGNFFLCNLEKVAKKNNVNLLINKSIPALSSFTFDNEFHQIYKTYLTQKMLEFKYLGSNASYFCIAHNEKIILDYLAKLDQIFYEISKYMKSGDDPKKLLKDDIAHSGFKRLN